MRLQFILLTLLYVSCNNTDEKEMFQPQIGDILFQDLDSSPLCDAIEIVTPGYKNANFSHIGIITNIGEVFCSNSDDNTNNDIRVLEAIPNKVQKTSLDSFLNRSFDSNNNPKVIVGRLKPKYQHTINNAITFLNHSIDIEYDDEFLMNNNKYYCSELIYEAFRNDSIFMLQKMTFLNPGTQDTLEAWRNYYSKIGIEIPQNKLGINPGIMSLSEKIDIIHIYGIPEGMSK